MCSRARLRQVPPTAVEGPALPALQQLGAAESRSRAIFWAASTSELLRHVLQPQAAERQRDAVADRLAADVDQLEAAAAEVAGNAVGRMEARNDAERRIMRLLAAGQHADLGAQDLLRRGG